MWSDYATEGRVSEYTAEAVRMFIEKPDELKSVDPEMYEFAKAFATQASYPSVRFSA